MELSGINLSDFELVYIHASCADLIIAALDVRKIKTVDSLDLDLDVAPRMRSSDL